MRPDKSHLCINLYENDMEHSLGFGSVEELLDRIYPAYDISNDKDFLELCEDINKRLPQKVSEGEETVYYSVTIYKGKFIWGRSSYVLRIKFNHEKVLIDKEMDHYVTTIKAHSWSYNFGANPIVFKYAEPVDENDTYDIVHVYDNALKIYDKDEHKLRDYISAPNGLITCYKLELYKQKG